MKVSPVEVPLGGLAAPSVVDRKLSGSLLSRARLYGYIVGRAILRVSHPRGRLG